METINDRVKILRKDVLKLTQDEFSSRIGLSRNFISQIESGIKFPSDRTIKDICREYDVNPDWLENGTGDMFIIPEDDTAALVSARERIIGAVTVMSNSDIEWLWNTIQKRF